MNAKEFLQQGYKLNELIKSNEEELEQLKALATSISSGDMSQDRVQSSPASFDKIGNVVAKIIDLGDLVNADINRMIALKQEIREVINNVSSTDEKLLLRYRYIHFYTWDEIGRKLYLSMRTIHRIHSTALKNVIVPVMYK